MSHVCENDSYHTLPLIVLVCELIRKLCKQTVVTRTSRYGLERTICSDVRSSSASGYSNEAYSGSCS